jgi:hypothetical protein
MSGTAETLPCRYWKPRQGPRAAGSGQIPGRCRRGTGAASSGGSLGPPPHPPLAPHRADRDPSCCAMATRGASARSMSAAAGSRHHPAGRMTVPISISGHGCMVTASVSSSGPRYVSSRPYQDLNLSEREPIGDGKEIQRKFQRAWIPPDGHSPASSATRHLQHATRFESTDVETCAEAQFFWVICRPFVQTERLQEVVLSDSWHRDQLQTVPAILILSE